jgi:hypothetical protein
MTHVTNRIMSKHIQNNLITKSYSSNEYISEAPTSVYCATI